MIKSLVPRERSDESDGEVLLQQKKHLPPDFTNTWHIGLQKPSLRHEGAVGAHQERGVESRGLGGFFPSHFLLVNFPNGKLLLGEDRRVSPDLLRSEHLRPSS